MPNIVIIGGGPAGIKLAQALEKAKPALPADYAVIVIDRRQFYWHIIGALRAPLDGEVAGQATIPYDRVFKGNAKFRIAQADATRFDGDFVYTDAAGADAKIPYKYLVVATGQKWAKELTLPNARQESLEMLAAQGEAIAAAKKIIVVGGGAVGVELAGEIAGKYDGQKRKDVTLVHRGAALMNDVYPAKLRESLRSQLESNAVTVKLGTAVTGAPDERSVTLADGGDLHADLVLFTTGGKANNDLVRAFDAAALAADGSVRVRDTFQVEGHDALFVVGDLADLPEQKQAAKIDGHVAIAAPNLVALAHGQAPYKHYKGQKELIVVTVGRKGGAGLIMGFNVGSWITSTIKSKGLFISQTRKSLGY